VLALAPAEHLPEGVALAEERVEAPRARLDERVLLACFGRWMVRTPLANVTSVGLTGPYSFWKTAGPARLAVTDRGLTFATNGERGVLISFAKPVWGLDRLGLIRHPALTVTVEDPERLMQVLGHRADVAAGLESLLR